MRALIKQTSEIFVNEQILDIENIPISIEKNTDYDSQMSSTSSLEQGVLNKLSSALSYFVVIWPKTPERKPKRETKKLCVVLTSSVRKRAIKEKIAIKKKMEAEKEKHKTER